MEKEIEAALHRVGIGLNDIASALQNREADGYSFRDEVAIRGMQSLISHNPMLLNSPEVLALLAFDLANAMERTRLKCDSLTMAWRAEP